MSNNPDEIRADIERTRHDLGRDVDALAEKVDPAKAVHRQGDRVRSRLTNLKESVMGSDHDTYGTSSPGSPGLKDQARGMAQDAQHGAEDAMHAVQYAPERVRRSTRGNPLAAGLIALGAGWLIGSLIPASQAEQDAAEKVKEQSGPVVDEAKSMAQDMGEHLKPQAEEAAASVKDTATSGAEEVKADAQHGADQVRADSQQAAQRVKDTAQES